MRSTVQKIAVVIPAHNEQHDIIACLTALERAINRLISCFKHIAVDVIVVLDSCCDNTQPLVENFRQHNPAVTYLICDFQNVGKVRALGVAYAIEQGADWLACTDADSQVAEDWLLCQLDHIDKADGGDRHCDMICGVVAVNDWAHLSANVKASYLAHYDDSMGHRHIHGANLSFSAKSYQTVGGFSALASHEDVALVEKFQAMNLSIIWSNQVRVITSSRLDARAKEGFAHFLANLCDSDNTDNRSNKDSNDTNDTKVG